MELELRRWTEDDAPALSAAIEASLDHLRPWMPWAADEPRTLEERRAWIREANAGSDLVLGILLDGEVVGGTGLHHRIGPAGREIGYWVHAGYVRRGIATETVRRVRDLAFADPEVEVVEIHHQPANVASARVARAAGFELVSEGADEWIWRTVRRP